MPDDGVRRRMARGRDVAAIMTVACAILVGAGALAALLATEGEVRRAGLAGVAAGLLVGAAAAGIDLASPPRSDLERTGRTSVTSTLFLRLVAGTATAVLALAALVGQQTLVAVQSRGLVMLAAIVGVASAAAALLSDGPLPRTQRSTRARLQIGIGLWLGSACAALAIAEAALVVPVRLPGADPAALLVLAASVLFAYARTAAHGFPPAWEVLLRRRTTARSERTLAVPVILAFALLFLSLLLFVLLGIGVTGVVDRVTGSPALLGVMLAILVAFVASVAVAMRLARPGEQPTVLYRPLTDPRLRLERQTLAVSLSLCILLLVATGVAYYRPLGGIENAWVHLGSLAILVGVGPYGFLVASEANRVRRLEERFPDFLREIAASHKGGLTLAESLRVAARADYGPLGDDVRKMADQVAWNVPFTEALERFSDRVRTPLIQRAVTLILEANRSGGASTDVLLAAARDARELKALENERRGAMALYTIVIYVTFLVFLGVAAVLYAQFVPQLVAATNAAQQASISGGDVFGGSGALDADQFQLFYYLAAMVQAVGDGIVAGMMGSGRAALGLRHAFLMALMTYLTFTFII